MSSLFEVECSNLVVNISELSVSLRVDYISIFAGLKKNKQVFLLIFVHLINYIVYVRSFMSMNMHKQT